MPARPWLLQLIRRLYPHVIGSSRSENTVSAGSICVRSGCIGRPSIQPTTVVSFVSANVNESDTLTPLGDTYVTVTLAVSFVEIIPRLTEAAPGPMLGVRKPTILV